MDDRLVPTVYALWRQPDLLPALTTQEGVVPRLRAGADLMLPGVYRRRAEGPAAYPSLKKSAPVVVNTDANLAAAAVGRAARSNHDLYMMAGRGKAVLLVHVIGDHLWQMGSRQPRPELGTPPGLVTSGGAADASDDESSQNADAAPDAENREDNASPENADGDARPEDSHAKASVSVDRNGGGAGEASGGGTQDGDALSAEVASLEVATPAASEPADMDQLLYDAFRRAWRTSARRLELPVLVSSFYAQHMQPNSGRPLDVKRSSYRKLSKFLERMQADGLVVVRELQPGVQSIVSVDMQHAEIRSFRPGPLPKQEEQQEPAPERTRSRPLQAIQELHLVSGSVSSLFGQLGVNKGSPLTAAQVRQLLTEYVNRHQLQQPDDKSRVVLDTRLAACLTQRGEDVTSVRREELLQRCLQRMSPAHSITFAGEPAVIKKGAVPAVELSTATRSGNKQVTLVVNLPTFGIDPAEFARRCQVGVAASTSVGPAPHKPPGTIQVLVQGNHIRYIAALLQDQYEVPKKYIKGLEKASKK